MGLELKDIGRLGLCIAQRRIVAWNRTGASLSRGSLAALNLDFVNASYVGIDGGDLDITANAVAVTTENAARCVLPADETIANGAKGNFIAVGACIVAVGGATNKGEFLAGTNGQVYCTPLTLTELDGLTAPTLLTGLALETASSGTVRAYWNCFGIWGLIGGGA